MLRQSRRSAQAFVSFCAPAQAVAFASRSSLVALPVMVERADLPPAVSRFIIPLAASVFRVGAAVAMPAGVLFLARLYGMTLSPAQLVSVAFATILSSFAVPGVPGGSIIAMVPVLAAANLPTMPPAIIQPFALALPWVESVIGLMIILGLKTRVALVAGSLMMTALTFGTMVRQDFQIAFLQLAYVIVFFLLLALRSWNLMSIDAAMETPTKGR